ncbi:MAG TPA: hypothetical protein VJL07_05710, partial [Dehalococcoidia bacterium]|nr:hypothetical protein [Dehalococcoidia bacterium]
LSQTGMVSFGNAVLGVTALMGGRTKEAARLLGVALTDASGAAKTHAAILDELKAKYGDLAKVAEISKVKVQEFGTAQTEAADKAAASSTKFSALKSNLTSLLASFGIIAGVAGIGLLVRKIGDLIIEAENLRRVQFAFERLSASLGVSSAEMLSSLRKATEGFITNAELMRLANTGILLGIPLTAKGLEDLASASLKLGRAMGIDATFALQSMMIGIGRQSRLVLDNLGIIVSSEAAYARYAASIGKSVDALSKKEMTLAFYRGTLDSVRDKLEAMGAAEEKVTTGATFQKWAVSAKNVAVEFGGTLNELPSLISDVFNTEPVILFAAALNAVGLDFGLLKQRMQEISEFEAPLPPLKLDIPREPLPPIRTEENIRAEIALAEELSDEKLRLEKELLERKSREEINQQDLTGDALLLAQRKLADATEALDDSYADRRAKLNQTLLRQLEDQEIQAAIDTAEKGTLAWLAAQMRKLDAMESREKEDAEKRGLAVSLIEQKYDGLRAEEQRKFSKERAEAEKEATQKARMDLLDVEIGLEEEASERKLRLLLEHLDLRYQMEIDAAKKRHEDTLALELAWELEKNARILEHEKEKEAAARETSERIIDAEAEAARSEHEAALERVGILNTERLEEQIRFLEAEGELKREQEETDNAGRIEEIERERDAAISWLNIRRDKYLADLEMSDIGEEEKAERRRQISEAETDGLARIDDDARVAKEKQERLHAARMRKIHADYRKAIGELEKALTAMQKGQHKEAADAWIAAASAAFGQHKGIATALAIISTLRAINAAMAEEEVPYYIRLAHAAAAAAIGYANVRRIRSTSPGGGGEGGGAETAGAAAAAAPGPSAPTELQRGGRAPAPRLGFDDPQHDRMAFLGGRKWAGDLVAHLASGFSEGMRDATVAGFPRAAAEAGVQIPAPAPVVSGASYQIVVNGMYGGRAGLRALRRELLRIDEADQSKRIG